MSLPNFIYYHPQIAAQLKNYAKILENRSQCRDKRIIEHKANIFIEGAANFVLHTLPEWNRLPEKHLNHFGSLSHEAAAKVYRRLLSLAQFTGSWENKEMDHRGALASPDPNLTDKTLEYFKRDRDVGRKWLFVAAQLSYGAVILCGDTLTRLMYGIVFLES